MFEPSYLPAELFTMVVDDATDGKDDFATLCNFSLVSRQWHANLNTRIYSRWSYDGERYSILSLWKFLRSVLCNRRIADSVYELNLQNWTFGLVYGRGRFVPSEDDLDLVRRAICKVRLQRIETSILEALHKADPRPLMALLLANLRNLTKLYAHLPETDIFLAEVLQKAVSHQQDQPQNDPPPLHSLREAHITSAWNYREDIHARDNYNLELSHLWPIVLLPNIQMLSVFDFESLGASGFLGDKLKESSITDLTLVCRTNFLLKAPDAMTLLTLPKKLTKLSFYLEDTNLRSRASSQISNVDLWNGIQLYEDCIKHLDIYRDCAGFSPPCHSPNNSHFGSMQRFKRLESLCIQPEVLLGGCCEDDPTPCLLRDTLPPTLKSLTLYGDEGLARNKTLARQLQDVIMSIDFPHLGHIALEMTFKNIHCYTDPADPPHEKVEQACRERGIKYETKQDSSCTKGGIGCRYYRQVEDKRLQVSSKLKAVRSAVTVYLRRLGKSTSKDGESTHGKPEFSSDNLDTYELPWDELTAAVLYPRDESESGWDFEDGFSEEEDWEEFDTTDSDWGP